MWIIGPIICSTGQVSRVVGWVFGVALDISGVIFLLVFDIHCSLFHASSSPPPVAGDMSMAFLHDFFLPLQVGFSFQFFYVLCRLRCLAVQRSGSRF